MQICRNCAKKKYCGGSELTTNACTGHVPITQTKWTDKMSETVVLSKTEMISKGILSN